MNANYFRLLLLGGLLIGSLSGIAQQVFPVNVSGQLIPPNSLRVNDYFTGERNNDLMFTVALNDPIEEMRQVKLQLSVEANGGIILRSDLATAPIITLDRNFPEFYTGADLLPYFNTLMNTRGQGVPLFLTPGLNGFCLEVIDLATEKIISNRGCATGFFNLAQPPLLQAPACDVQIEQSSTQNLTFSWLPMHNASGNPINDLNYIFQLVEVPEGFQNPKDAFDAGFYIYTEEVRNMTALLYTEAEPLLEAGKNYAWRVRAQALSIDGAIVPLFDNNGYSSICTFSYLNPVIPPDPADFSSCTGSPCNFSGSIDATPKGEGFFSGDMVKVGYYSMTLQEVSYDNGNETYSGTGSIFVEFLGTSIAVEFFDLGVNANDRAYSGEVKARIDNQGVIPGDFAGDFTPMSGATAGNVSFDDDAALSLLDYFDTSPTKLVSNLEQAGASGITGLPIGLDVSFQSLDYPHIIAVTDILFTPTTSKLNAVYATRSGEDSVIKFGSKGVCFRAKGLTETAPQLFLLQEVNLETALDVPMVLEPFGAGGPGTSVSWSCQGFEAFSLQGRVQLSSNLIVPANPLEETITARFSGTANSLNNFTASVEMPAFTIPGLEDFTFSIGEGFFDYSSTSQLENVTWPEGYDAPENDWEGFYFPEITVALPDMFGGSLGADVPNILGTHIIYDSDGFTGKFSGINLLTGDGMSIGGWPFNVDLFSLSFLRGTLNGSEFNGKCKLPFMDGGDWLSFEGLMIPSLDSSTGLSGWDFELGVLPDLISIDLFRADFRFGETSKITIPYLDGSFGWPRCDFSGSLAFNIPESDDGFDPQFMGLFDGLESLLGSLGIGDLSTNFDLSGLEFEHMKFDWDSDPKFSFGTIRPVDLDLSFLGIDADISAISWKQIGVDEFGVPKFGFDFDIDLPSLGIAAPDINFNIGFNWNSSASPSNPSGGSLFDFDGFDLDFGLPEFGVPDFDFSCGDDVPEITFESTSPVPSIDDLPTLKVGFFDLTDIQNLAQGSVENSFTGLGKINVPALGPFGDLAVKLKDVVVNEAGQIISGTVETAIDDAFDGAEGLQGAAGDILNAANEKVSSLASSANNLFSLPIVLGISADGTNERDQGLIITGIEFGAEGAAVDAKIVVPLGNNQFAEFDAQDLELVPNGIAGGELRIGLTTDFELPIPGDEALNITGYNGESGSYVAVDCGGFVEFNLQGVYDLPEDKFSAIEGDSPVGLAFTINTQEWGEFLGTVAATEPFALNGLNGFTFELGEGRLDFSPTRNVSEMVFPNGYTAGGATWKGFFAPEVTITAPSTFTTGNGPTTFTASNVLIDSLGLSSDLTGRDLVDLSTGVIGNWGASVDSFVVVVRQNDLISGIMGGGMQLPIMADDEALPYTASFAPAAAPNDYNFDFTARPDEVTISLLRSRISFSEDSEITVGYVDGEFQTPVVDLSGTLTFNAPANDDGFGEEFDDLVATLSSAFPDMGDLRPEFNMDGISFEHFRFDPGAEQVFNVESIIPENTSVSFLGQSANLSEINFADIEVDEEAIAAGINENVRLVGFNFETVVGEEFLGLLAPTVTLSLQITEDPIQGGEVNYDFYKFDMDYEVSGLSEINADCQGEQEAINFSDENYAGEFTAESFNAGYFTIDELDLTQDNGTGGLTGTGRVTVPALGPMRHLDVAFTDIQLDANGQMRSGEIITQSDTEEDAADESLSGILGSAQAKLNAVADAFKLPIMMGSESLGFTIVGLRLQPEEATVQARVIVPSGEDSFIEFVGDGLQIVPNGISSAEVRMFLGEDTSIEGLVGMPITLVGGTNQEVASFATCDCDGFQGFTLKAQYEFPTNQLKNLENEGDPVIAILAIESAAWGDFTGSIGGFDEFGVPGLDGFKFNVPGGLFDFSDTRSLASAVYPEGFGDVSPEWNGFVIPAVNVSLPKFFITGDEQPSFEGTDLIIDTRGLFGDFKGINLFDASIGSLGGWGFAMDTFNMKFWDGELSFGNFSGGLRLPIMGDGEFLPMLGSFDANFNFEFDIKPIDVNIDLFNATFAFAETSSIDIDFINGAFRMPKMNLDGLFNFSLPEGGDGMSGDFMNQLTGLLGNIDGFIPTINLDGIKFTGMKFDWDAPQKFSIESFEPLNANIDFWGLDFDLSSIQWLQMSSDSTSTSNGGNWALNFNLVPDLGGISLGDLTFSFELNDLFSGSGASSNGSGSWFDFSGLDLNWGSGLSLPSFDFECAAEPFDESLNDDAQTLTALTNIPQIDGIPTIQIGYFNVALENMADIALDEATGALTGVGEIELDFLGPFSTLAVDFQGVVVNEAGRIVEGTVKTSIDEVLDVGDALPDPNALLYSVTTKLNGVTDAVNDFFTLPVVLGAENAEGMNEGLIITGVELRPEKAIIAAEVVIPVGNTHARFGVSGLEVVPGGIADFELVMGLVDDIELPTIGGMEPIEFAKYNPESGEGSRIKLDCSGFVEFELVGTYTFPTDQLVHPASPDEPVVARFAMNTQEWGEFIGTFTGMEQFAIADYLEFPFSIEGGIIDYSTSRNSDNAVFPEDYDVDDSWTGFFLPSMSVGMPSLFSNGDEPLTFSASNMIIDGEGVTANVKGRNVFDLSTGSLGGWGYSLDSITMSFVRNEYVEGRFGGGFQLPLMDDEEYIPYNADLDLTRLGQISVGFEARPDEVGISLLRSKFKFDPSSSITVGIEEGEFQTPKVNLTGTFTVDFGGDGSESSSQITDLLNEIGAYFSSYDIPDLGFAFESEGIRFENFIFDMDAEDKFSVGSITPQQTSISFLGQNADLEGIELTEIDAIDQLQMLSDELDTAVKNLSFSFETKVFTQFLGGLAPTVKMDMVMAENLDANSNLDYAFKGFNLDWEAPDVNFACTSDLEPLRPSTTPFAGAYAPASGPIKVGRFSMDELNLTTNDNGTLSGTGRIEVPVFGPMRYLDVAFEDVKLNADGEIYEGEIVTQSDMSNAAETDDMGILMNTALNKLSEGANELVQLPIVMGDPESFAFTVVGLSFGPTEAALQTRLIVSTGEDTFLEFVAEGLEIVPDGIADVSAKIGLAREFTIPGLDNVLPIRLHPYDRENDEGTYASCDCDGFQLFNLEGELEFSRNYVLSKQLDEETQEPKTVTAAFNASSEQWGTMLGNISVNDSIYLVGVEELPFFLGEALIDFDEEEDHEGIAWPEGYQMPSGGGWQGVYIANASMPLPQVLTDYSEGEPGYLRVEKLVMDPNGFTGKFRGERLLDMETTELYGFGMALDSFEVRFQANTFLIGQMDGRFNLPLMEAGDGIPFQSFLTPGINGQEYMNFLWQAKPSNVAIPMLSANFRFNNDSEITINRTATGFSYPRFDLSGSFTVAGDGAGLGNEFDDLIEAANEITGTEILPDFDLDSISFEHFVFDYEEEEPFSIASITPNNSEVTFLGQTVELSEIDFGELVELGMQPDSAAVEIENLARSLGFRFDVVADLPVLGEIPIGFTFNLNEIEEAVDGIRNIDYDFGGMSLDYDFPDLAIPDFSCESPEPPEPPADQTVAELTRRTRVTANGFKLTIKELNGNSGSGTVRIPFLNYNMNVTFNDLEVNAAGEMLGGTILTDTEGSLVPDDAINTDEPDVPILELSPALTSFLETTQEFFTLPISLADKLEETAGLELPDGLDIILLGIVWTENGGKMNMAITIPSIVEGSDPLQFGVRGLNIRPDGIDLGELKVFLAETIRF